MMCKGVSGWKNSASRWRQRRTQGKLGFGLSTAAKSTSAFVAPPHQPGVTAMKQELLIGIESERDNSATTVWMAIIVAATVLASAAIVLLSRNDELRTAIGANLTDYAVSIATYEMSSDYLPDHFYEQQKHAEVAQLPPQF
jgi:hypothetical protein